MTEIVKPKNKGGRPKGSTKAKKGALIWVQSEYVDMVQAFYATLQQQSPPKPKPKPPKQIEVKDDYQQSPFFC